MINIKTLRSLASEFSVLYVEDDTGLSKIMNRYFEKIFKKVDNAENGKIVYEFSGKEDINTSFQIYKNHHLPL